MTDAVGAQVRRRYWPTRTLRNGLVLVVVAALLPMTILSVIQGRMAWNDSRALATAQVEKDARLIAESEGEVFVMARQAVRFLSRTPAVRAMNAQCTDILVNARGDSPGIVNFVRSDATGRARCSGLRFTGIRTFADQSWWQRAIKAKGLSLSLPTIGRISKKPVLIMAMPVQTAEGANDGLVTAAISLDALKASLKQRQARDPQASITILDATGAVMLKQETGSFPRPRDLLAGNRVTVRGSDGVEWLYGIAPLQGNDLTVVYAKPRDDLLGLASWQARQSIVLPLVVVAIASLAIWLGTHWLVVRWLRKLQRLAAQFGRGDYASDRIAYGHAPREVVALSNELHTMAETIHARDAALTSALETKIALTREVNHRVKNNLQIVTSLLTLQADRVADPWARDALGQAKARIAALGLIHRVLYEHDTFNASGAVEMCLVLTELGQQLRAAHRTNHGVELSCECDEFEVTVDQAVPLTLFVVEAVTNAFRHGYVDGRAGAISVVMTSSDDRIRLSIRDNGIGYVATNPIGKMGFDLMNAFALQLNGELDVSSNDTGTHVKLNCPLAQYQASANARLIA